MSNVMEPNFTCKLAVHRFLLPAANFWRDLCMLSRKICLIGDFGVGKTSLIRRFVDQQFNDEYLSTVGVKISKKQVELSEPIQLIIWDIEGETRFKPISSSYLQGAKGAILVADVTRPETVLHLKAHSAQFLKINPKGLIVVTLNKTDLLDAEQIEQLIDRYPIQADVCGTFLTSAKIGTNVDQIFQTIAQSSIV